MRKSRTTLALALVFNIFFSACTQSGRSGSPDPGHTPGNPPGGPNNNGTVDGGGGAGILGKPIESYKVPITDSAKFPEYEQFIAPILKDTARVYGSSQDYFGSVVHFLAEKRSWYMVPIELNKIPDSKMGIPFSTDQWAYQTSGAIWISSLHYGGQPIDKACILLHEFLVGLKILRHLSNEEQCNAMSFTSPWFGDDHCHRSTHPLFDTVSLTPQDYDQVRNVADWLLSHHATMTGEQLAQTLHSNQFQSSMINFYEKLPDPDTKNRAASLFIERARAMQNSVNKTMHFYADFDSATHVAGKRCDVTLSMLGDKTKLNAKISVSDKKNTPSLSTIQGTFPADFSRPDAFGDIGPWNSANPTSLFYFTVDNSPPHKRGPYVVGKVVDDSMQVNFEFFEITSVWFREMIAMTSGDADGNGAMQEASKDGSVECYASEIQLPPNYAWWRELPKQDREALERRWFGDTVDNLVRSGKYDIHIPQ